MQINSKNQRADTTPDSIEDIPWILIIILLYNFSALLAVIVITITQPTDHLSTITGCLFLAQTSILIYNRNIIGWYFMVFWTLALIIKIHPIYFIKSILNEYL